MIRKAERKQAKIRMGLQGPSGSGKTYSSLLIGYGLSGNWENIVLIDSENHSADLYAHLGPFNVLSIAPPFPPEKYIQAIKYCEEQGMQVIIIDSISHEWEGTGGILDLHSSMAGNSFTNWAKLTPRHNAFIQAIIQSKLHIIATIRSKQDYVLIEKNGKHIPEKVGLKGITREGMDYELTLVLDLDIKHYARASKDRTGLFMDKPDFIPSEETGKVIKQWCLFGTDVEDIRNSIHQCNDLDHLKELYLKYNDFQNILRPEFTKQKEYILKNLNINSNGKQ